MSVMTRWWTWHAAAEAPDRLGPQAAEFLRHLDRFRRRLQAVAMCRHAVAVGSVAIVAVEVVAIAKPEAISVYLLAKGVLGVGLALVLAMAWLRRPTLLHTATALDLRTRRDDGLATALQFAGAGDPVARIVHRHAIARVAVLEPRNVFPLEAPPHARVLLAAVAITTIVCALDRTMAPPRWSLVGGSVVMGGGPAQGQAGTRLREESVPELRAAAAPASAPFARVPAEGPPDEAPTQPAANDRVSPQARTAESTVPGQSADWTPGGDGSSTAAGTASDGGAAGVDGDQSAANRYGHPSGTRRPARGPGSGAGAGGSVADAGGVKGAGGVKHSALAGPADRFGFTAGPNTPGYTARYRAARQRADVAVKQERVPPHLRLHVRQYFATIRPAGLP